MASLETQLLGISFKNPFILAAGPPTAKGSMSPLKKREDKSYPNYTLLKTGKI